MAPAKRKNATAVAASKKARATEWADIGKEITRADDLSREVQSMLIEVLPLSLGEFSDRRHKFQEQMVSVLGDALSSIEERRASDVAKYQADLEVANKKKAENEAATIETQLQKEAKAAKVLEDKVALAHAAEAFRSARDAKTRADDEKRIDEKEVSAAQKSKAQYSSMMEDLEFLQSALPEAIESSGKGASLLSMMRKWNFEESLQIVLPSVFAKAPDARGQFDGIALDGLAKGIRKRIAEQDEKINAAVPMQEKHEAAIAATQEALKSTTASQILAAKSYEEAASGLRYCEEQCVSAQKAAKEGKRKISQLTSNLNGAEAELEIFRDGPLANFQKLQQRTELVVEEPTVTPQEEPVLETASGEEQTKVADDAA